MQMPRSELIIVEQPSGGHKTPRYQTEEMHYEWRFERLARYCARPPIAMERLEPLADGRLLYRFKRPWRDGTTCQEQAFFLWRLSGVAHYARIRPIRNPLFPTQR